MTKQLITGGIGTALSAIGTITQTNEILQTISLIITILGAILSFIVIPLITWYQKAKKDGKIDVDELKDGVQKITDGVEKVNDVIKVEESNKKEEK